MERGTVRMGGRGRRTVRGREGRKDGSEVRREGGSGGDTEREGSGSRQGGKEGRAEEQSGKRDVVMWRARGEGRTQWGQQSCRWRRSAAKEGEEGREMEVGRGQRGVSEGSEVTSERVARAGEQQSGERRGYGEGRERVQRERRGEEEGGVGQEGGRMWRA
jgi:hypothetical protein